MWSVSLRNAVFAAVLVEYLRSGGLLLLPQAAEVLGSTLARMTAVSVFIHCLACLVKDEWQDRFALSAEDYLQALISMVNELVSIFSSSQFYTEPPASSPA